MSIFESERVWEKMFALSHTSRDRKTLMAVTVMYRVKGYDPANQDWYWVKYEPHGRASSTTPTISCPGMIGKTSMPSGRKKPSAR